MRRASPLIALRIVVGILGVATLATAAEGEGGQVFTAPIGWVFRWLQFLAVFGGAGYLIARRAPAYFRQRAETIVASITESTRLKHEAEQRLREAEERLGRLDQDLAALRSAAQQDWAVEAERIRQAARDEAQKIERAGQAEIAATERAARVELKAMAARLATDRAEALLLQRITPETQAAILRTFVEQLSRSAH